MTEWLTRPLAEKMRIIAATGLYRLPPDWHDAADAFEQAGRDFFGATREIDADQFTAAWKRARTMYDKVTGDRRTFEQLTGRNRHG